MNVEFLTTAALARKQNAEKDAAANKISSAVSNYKRAAENYRKAAEADRANRQKWLNEAEDCEQAIKDLSSPRYSAGSAGGGSRPVSGNTNDAPKFGSGRGNVSDKPKPVSKANDKSKPVANGGGDEKPRPTIEEALAKLNELTGLKNVKNTISAWVATVTINNERKAMGLPVAAMSYHMVFNGNPGTGKTTVARIIADIYYALGISAQGQLVECKANDLIAGYVGQTAIKTQEVIDKALGGVLFIDEAYTLNSNSFGQEAIDTLLKAMEDHRDELVVVVAGYDDLMGKFIDSNPGLKSRFKTYVKFDDYNGEELYEIFINLCNKNKYVLDDGLDEEMKKYFENYYRNRDENFGNARDVRNIFENTLAKMNVRLKKTANHTYEELTLIRREDLPLE